MTWSSGPGITKPMSSLSRLGYSTGDGLKAFDAPKATVAWRHRVTPRGWCVKGILEEPPVSSECCSETTKIQTTRCARLLFTVSLGVSCLHFPSDPDDTLKRQRIANPDGCLETNECQGHISGQPKDTSNVWVPWPSILVAAHVEAERAAGRSLQLGACFSGTWNRISHCRTLSSS